MQGIKQAIVYVVVALVFILLVAAIPLYIDWLWFIDLGYGSVFTTMLSSKVLLGLITAVIFFLVVWGSALYALRSNAGRIELYTSDVNLPIFLDRMIRRGVEFIVLVSAIAISIMAGIEASTHWESWIKFNNFVPFGQVDPVFNIDIGFYVFKLDFLQFVYRTALFALIASGIAAAAILYLTRTVDILAGKLKITNVAAGHLGIILALIALIQAFGFRLNAYELLFTQGPALFGADKTDLTIRLLSYQIAMVATIIGAALVLFAARQKNLPLAAIGVFLGLAVNLILGQGVGAVYQRMVVNPNELSQETPYIQRHLEATRAAYDLEDVQRVGVQVARSLSVDELQANKVTLQSVRLWDYRPLQAAYAQLQNIQQYYTLNEIDIDRYMINGTFRQVMLSPRELDPGGIESQTWVNLRLIYTHGYGVAMSPVNEVTEEGLPVFFIKDMPPQSSVDVEVTQPQIYFGENTNNYVLVNTTEDEFDYPSEPEYVKTRYEADSGLRLGNYLRRMLFALRFGDLNIQISTTLNPDSRILFRRNIVERVKTLAPFLRFDGDPYIVINDGKIYWFHDAYTISDRYPYSQPSLVSPQSRTALGPQTLNYIRNSVKVVTDAYTGEVNFYVYDEDDPIIQCYANAFQGMFKPKSEMPKGLQRHVRYPEDLFRLQAYVYQTYHMVQVQQYYNRADLWAIPVLDISEGNTRRRGPMEPIYLLMRLPDEDQEEFILLTPYRRANRDNMVAWMAAKCDPDNYGELVVYEFPKGEQFFGPAQIQARSNQNTFISEQLTLWDQQNTRVFRGNLMVLPIEEAILYVEPLYLQAVNAEIPELKRVIVAIGNEITMQPTLGEALEVLVGRGALDIPGLEQTGVRIPIQEAQVGSRRLRPADAPVMTSVQAQAVQDALDAYERALDAQRRGDWAEYGRRVNDLGSKLRQAAGEEETQAEEPSAEE